MDLFRYFFTKTARKLSGDSRGETGTAWGQSEGGTGTVEWASEGWQGTVEWASEGGRKTIRGRSRHVVIRKRRRFLLPLKPYPKEEGGGVWKVVFGCAKGYEMGDDGLRSVVWKLLLIFAASKNLSLCCK